MLMQYLAALMRGVGSSHRTDDDFVDKLNYVYTSTIIFLFCLTVSMKQYVGQPIQCWVPAQFTSAWEQYTENYCWVENTYYVPVARHTVIPIEYTSRRERQLCYYQWVPFFLGLSALLFYAPTTMWRGLLQWHAGVQPHSLGTMATEAKMMAAEERMGAVASIAGHIQDALEVQREVMDARFSTSLITALYMCTKVLYLLNAAAQVFLLDAFLGMNDPFFGLRIARDLLAGREWEVSGAFPRVTLCDFEVRVLGNVHHHTVQCVLMINMFNEKLFLFLWFWFVMVAVVTFLSLLHWTFIAFVPGQRVGFIRRYLRATDLASDAQSVKRFVHKFLGVDGVFCVRMISAHAGDMVTTELVVALWNLHSPPMKKMDDEGVSGKQLDATLRRILIGAAKGGGSDWP